jgi:hypothetical protein
MLGNLGCNLTFDEVDTYKRIVLRELFLPQTTPCEARNRFQEVV